VPWKDVLAVEERSRFVMEYLRRTVPMALLCGTYGISRKTGYKWVERFRAEGERGLEERSRAPHGHSKAIAPEVEAAIVEARGAHPWWGPRKLLVWLSRERPELLLPAASTAGEILKAHGLVTGRRKRARAPRRTEPFGDCDRPNATWCADYKGEFRVGSGETCYPLTITDAHSRYLLCCEGLSATSEREARPVFERTFREYGLPDRMRTDGGSPFASRAPGGLSRLSVWWIKLGIEPERTRPGKPQDNGRHERMHLTLKQETALPPRSSEVEQQSAFDGFRQEYNEVRPHEALGQRTPASVYVPSPRPYPETLPEMAYPTSFAVRAVRTAGEIKWRNELVFVSEALVGELVGIEDVDEGIWRVHFGPRVLGLLDYEGHFYRDRNYEPGRSGPQGGPQGGGQLGENVAQSGGEFPPTCPPPFSACEKHVAAPTAALTVLPMFPV